VTCPICNLRKEKRFCPAVHGRICAQCCGEQREVTLDCPSECTYLQQARAYEKPRDLNEFDKAAFFPQIEIDEQFLHEREHLLLGLTFALAKSARTNRSLQDRDLIAALASLARSYETRVNSNLIYGEPTANLEHQAIALQIEELVKEFRAAEQEHTGGSRLRDSEVLKAIVFLLRLGLSRTSGRLKSRAFVDFLFSQFPENKSALASADEASGRIIVP